MMITHVCLNYAYTTWLLSMSYMSISLSKSERMCNAKNVGCVNGIQFI